LAPVAKSTPCCVHLHPSFRGMELSAPRARRPWSGGSASSWTWHLMMSCSPSSGGRTRVRGGGCGQPRPPPLRSRTSRCVWGGEAAVAKARGVPRMCIQASGVPCVARLVPLEGLHPLLQQWERPQGAVALWHHSLLVPWSSATYRRDNYFAPQI